MAFSLRKLSILLINFFKNKPFIYIIIFLTLNLFILSCGAQKFLPPIAKPRVDVGEADIAWCSLHDEQKQAAAFMTLYDTAINLSGANITNWGLWDYIGGTNCNAEYELAGIYERVGFGFSPIKPRDLLGQIVERRSQIPGGDFESGTSEWFIGGDFPNNVKLIHQLEDEGSPAATGNFFLRMKMTKPGNYWLCSPEFNVKRNRSAISAYVRTSSTFYQIEHHYRDIHGWTFETQRAPLMKRVFTDLSSINKSLSQYVWDGYTDESSSITTSWTFLNFQDLLAGYIFELPKETQSALICFTTTANSNVSPENPEYLDLDSVSVNSF